MPVFGLSKYTSGQNQAHAILCGMQTIGDPNYPGCSNSSYVSFGYYRLGYSTNGRNLECQQDPDWDPGMAEGGCPCTDYVAAVVQDQVGYIEGVLCCPGVWWDQQGNSHRLAHSGCNVENFYSTDSVDFYTGDIFDSPDWDPNYYKGQCQSGQYVAGVSTVVYSSTGEVPGAPNALYCCSD